MAALIILTIFLLSAFVFNRALGDGVTLGTDKPSYTVGETVAFSGSGYGPDTTYGINISYVELGGHILVESLEFTPIDSAIPIGVTWAIPFDAENGTYIAETYDALVPDTVIASTTFEVLNATEALRALEGNLTDLKDLVVKNVTAMGINNSLLASLNNSMRKLEGAFALFEEGENKTAANQLRAARNMLTAFVHKVLAQSGKKIDNATAKALVGNASAYIEYVDSMIVSAELPLGKKMALNVQRTLEKQEAHLLKFMVKKGFIDPDQTIEVLLHGANERKQKLLDLLEEENIDPQSFTFEMLRTSGEALTAKELAEELMNSLGTEDGTRSKKLGQYIQLAKDLLRDAEALENSSHWKGVGKGRDQGTGAEDDPETQNPGKAKGRQDEKPGRRHGPK